MNHHHYQQLVGKLLYLMHTWPDINFSVNLLNQFMHVSHEIHRQEANRVLAYLKGGLEKGLMFPRSSDLTVKVYTDVDFARSVVDCRSKTGYFTFVFGSLVTWKSSKQDKVSHSSAEVKHSATATTPIAIAIFPCVTEKRERSRVPRLAGIGAAYSRCRL